jgi:hypothetical protein
VTDHDVLAFVAASIRSVWTLELLLFLKRNREQSWDAGRLIRELRSSSAVISEALVSLEACGLVIQEDRVNYRYGAASPKLDQIVAELDQLYAAKPLTVINAIVNSQNQQLRIFSNAFKLKD